MKRPSDLLDGDAADLRPSDLPDADSADLRPSDLPDAHAADLLIITGGYIARNERIELANVGWKDEVRQYCDRESVNYAAALVYLLNDAFVRQKNAEKA